MDIRTDCESRFNGIYEQFARKVYAYFSSGFGPDVAEDLSQQTFLMSGAIWKAIPGLRRTPGPPGSFT
jgi:DNA-directed RNA polymerase specialized sigma24 family protein